MNINRTLGPILATILWMSPAAWAADLTLQVQGLDAPSGTLHVALFGPPSFARAGFDLPAEGATQTVTLR